MLSTDHVPFRKTLVITIFPDTLFPVSLYGFFVTGTAILGSGAVGGIVGTTPRLRFVRICIVLQKATVGIGYALFLILFLEQKRIGTTATWVLYAIIVIVSSILNLVTVRCPLPPLPAPSQNLTAPASSPRLESPYLSNEIGSP